MCNQHVEGDTPILPRAGQRDSGGEEGGGASPTPTPPYGVKHLPARSPRRAHDYIHSNTTTLLSGSSRHPRDGHLNPLGTRGQRHRFPPYPPTTATVKRKRRNIDQSIVCLDQSAARASIALHGTMTRHGSMAWHGMAWHGMAWQSVA